MSYKYLTKVSEAEPFSDGKLSTSPVYKNSMETGTPSVPFSTLYELFQQACTKFGPEPCLGAREGASFKFMTYAEVSDTVSAVASALKHVGLEPQGRVGVYGPNSPFWMMAMQACNAMSLWCVPLYDTLGDNAIEYIISHSSTSAVFAAGPKLKSLIKSLPQAAADVKNVIYWGTTEPETVEEGRKKGVAIYSFDEFTKLGKENPAAHIPPSAKDLCTIMYTSGTTGDPKGVLITHEAVVASVATLVSTLKPFQLDFGVGDRFLSYLPLAHIFDRVTEEWLLANGSSIGYWQGDVAKLVDDAQALKPTIFIGVPRVFDRVYSRAVSALSGSWLKTTLFNMAKGKKLTAMKAGKKTAEASPLWDAIVFKKFKAALGGHVRVICSGGAPLAPHVEEFLRVAMCCPVVQGYGLTETCASSFIAMPDVMSMSATVGAPFHGVEFKLESVPEMNYDAQDEASPKGEILIRTRQMFSGYYKNQEMTADVLEKDGWFHTGDIGTILEDGALRIIDRKKNIFKLSQGEYVAAEKVEAVYKKNVLVDQIWVYGDSFKSAIIAVVVPNKDKLEAWAKTKAITKPYEELCADPLAAQWVMTELNAPHKGGKDGAKAEDLLRGFELVKGVHLEPKPFAIEDDLLTPTFKLKRAPLKKRYEAAIEKLYAAIEKAEASRAGK